MAAYGWDDEVEVVDSSFTLLDEGEYPFVVKDFERGRVKSGKFNGCDQAVYTLHVTPADGPSADIFYRIPLNTDLAWKATQFFRAIGQLDQSVKAGDKTVFPWDRCIGCRGKAELSIREYASSDGQMRKTNDVVRVMPVDSDGGYGDL